MQVPPAVPTPPTGQSQAINPVLARTPNGSAVQLGDGRYTVDDFSPLNVGVNLGTAKTGLTGAGAARTTVLMNPRTSTKASTVPTTPWTTNQLYLMSVSGSPTLSGFTLQGTDQGHLYNGLRIGQATGATVSDVAVRAIPGDSNIPPGETFGLNDWRTSGSRYSRIEVDGAGVGASGFATNNSTSVTVSDSVFHDNRNAGAAFWQTQNVTLTDVTVANNLTGLNFERVTGDIRLVRPVFRNNPGQDIYFGTDRTSATVTIIDPVYSGAKLRIQVPRGYMGAAATQLKSDVHVIIGGVDRTAEVVHWVGNS